MNKKLRQMAECALLIALATALSFVKLYQAPLGGSVTLISTLPIMFISVRYGLAWGFSCGFLYSLIQLWQGAGNLAYVPTFLGVVGCIAFDYILPFTLLGVAGIFCKRGMDETVGKSMLRVICGCLLATVLRFGCHFLGGAVVWYEITKEGEWNDYVKTVGMWTYSFVYNITYMGPDGALAVITSGYLPVIDEAINKVTKR